MNFKTAVLASAIVGFGLFAVPTTSTAQVTKSGKKYVFRIKFKKGEKFEYSLTNSMSMPGSKAADPKPMVYSWLTKSVSGNNAIITMTGNGSSEDISMNSRGETNSKSAVSMFSNEMAVLPEKAVAIGDSWTSSGKTQGITGAMDVKTTSTFKGIKTVDGKQMAHIAISIKMSGSGVTGSGTGDTLTEMSNGMSYRANIKLDLKASNPQDGKTMNIKVATSINRK